MITNENHPNNLTGDRPFTIITGERTVAILIRESTLCCEKAATDFP